MTFSPSALAVAMQLKHRFIHPLQTLKGKMRPAAAFHPEQTIRAGLTGAGVRTQFRFPSDWLRIGLMLAALTGVGRDAFAQASVEGRVTLPKARTTPVMNKRYEIVTQGGILSTNPPLAVVYLEGTFPLPPAAPTPQITQKDMAFSPAILPVQAGTRVEFPNLDNTYHNIFSYSPAKRFDLGRYRPDERPIPSVIFDQTGLVVLRCDIHEHMRGLILVLGGPYFVLTNAAGEYQLTGLPAGHYVLKVWLNSQTTLERAVDLTDGATIKADFP